MSTVENKIMRKRLLSAYASSVLSISLVLLLVGVASLLLVNAGNVSAYFKEHLKISVIFDHCTTEKQALSFKEDLEKQPYIKSVEYVSREQGVQEMEELLGKDFLSVFDSAPIPISLNVSLRAEYVEGDKVEAIMDEIGDNELVEEVMWQKSLIEALNSNLRVISAVLGVLIILLMFISFVLINNTVRLNLYSKRFTIHTMRLVGATKSFIRAPFLIESSFQGLISAFISIIIVLAGLIVVKNQFPLMFSIFQLRQLFLVMLIVIAAGEVICVGTSFFVVGRMVTMRKEELYY